MQYTIHKLQSVWSPLTHWKVGHILSHVWRSASETSELILRSTLCVAHSNTLGDPPLVVYWFPQTSLLSSVLATAAEDDERGREGGVEGAVKEGEGKWIWYSSSINMSKYLMKMGLFRYKRMDYLDEITHINQAAASADSEVIEKVGTDQLLIRFCILLR